MTAAPQGFTDEQQQAIRGYLPKAKDAADLAQFAHDVSGGTHTIGNAQQILDYLKKGGDPSKLQFTDPVAAQAPAQQPSTLENLRNTIGEGILNALDGVIPGLGSVLRGNRDSGKAFTEHVANSMVGDYGPEVGGFLHTILSPSEYSEFAANLDRNVAHERAIMQGDSADHGVASLAGELGGTGLDAMLGNEAGLGNLSRLGKTAVAAGQGAIYGSGAAGPGNRVAGAITGAALGAGTDLALPIIGKAIASRVAGDVANREFANAATRQGVDYMAADLPNATKSKFATSLSALTLGGIPLAEQGVKNVASAGNAVSRVASNIGNVADRTGAGQAAQSGANQFVKSSGDTLDALESKIPIAANAPATVANTRSALSNLAQSFSSNPKLAGAFADPRIKAYRAALTPQTTQEATGLLDAAGNPITRDVTQGGGLSWQDLRDFRSRVGEIIGQPGLASDGAQIGQLRSLYGALSDDIRQTAADQGPDALNAWSRWNNYARARANRIGNVVSLILGNDSNKAPQSAFEALQRLAQQKGGDPIKLAQALRSMPQDEANTVRATILEDLGHAPAGQQNDVGNVFSPANFVTQWNKISDRAKNVLFTGDHRDALNDLAKVFSGMKSSTKFANSSKTGIGVIASTHTVPAVMANPVLGALDMALQYGGGKLLASPAFARRVASTPMSMAGARAYWSRPWVNAIAAKEPVIAAEIKAFQGAFLNNANDNSAASLAAQPAQPNKATPQPLQPGQYDQSTWEKRPDGTTKGTGYLGVLQRPDGSVSTEISVGLPINGKEMDIPTLVPGLTPQEVNWLLTTPVDRVAKELPDSIRQKAIAHAKARIAMGLSPFKQDNER